MSHSVRLVLVLHNHQPVGNFDGVIEQAYQDSYLPFLDLFEQFEGLRIGLHTSGPLMEWLDKHHPEYLDRLAGLVATGRIEIVGGPFYEPILTMIPSRDRVGQIRLYTEWLEQRLGAVVRGMWTPERVWEQCLVSDLAEAGIGYTLLDDFHFKNAGLPDDALHGYYLTEDAGRMLAVFPGSERLRYLIPFAAPHETIDMLGDVAQRSPGSVVVFADDGEKFGTWPETKAHVYDNGWLRQFFELLSANSDWIQVTTPAEAQAGVAPLGKIYLPEGSYREMTEWVLPTERLLEYEELRHELERDGRWSRVASFVRGGYWRNFKAKYPETDEMYARMLQVSDRLQEATERLGGDGSQRGGEPAATLAAARRELYRGQCNCSYWHGAFGGIYLPHLRNAVYRHLIGADNLLESLTPRDETAWVEARVGDWNLDARQEIRLAGDRLVAYVAPADGGQLYELDIRSIRHNLLATLARRPEAYHRKVLAGGNRQGDDASSIHERVVFKQEGLDERLQYDRHPRKSLLDHFYDENTTAAQVEAGTAEERGDFLRGAYESRIRRNPERIQLQLSRAGRVERPGAEPLQVTVAKAITLEAGGGGLEIGYRLEGLPPGCRLLFAPELNFAGMPAGADDRFFYDASRNRLGQLGSRLDLSDASALGLVDEWLGIDVQLTFNRPGGIWTFPIEAVSQSEAGFELVHQSVVVQPHWLVEPEADGSWSVALHLVIDTSQAERRAEQTPATTAAGSES